MMSVMSLMQRLTKSKASITPAEAKLAEEEYAAEVKRADAEYAAEVKRADAEYAAEVKRAEEEYAAAVKRTDAEYDRMMRAYKNAEAKYQAKMNDYKRKYDSEIDRVIKLYGYPDPTKLNLPPKPQIILPPSPVKPPPPVKRTVVKRNVVKRTVVKRKVVNPESSEVRLPAPVDPRAILSQYDLKKVEHSAFDYFQAVRSVADKMLDVLDDIFMYEAAHPEDCPPLNTHQGFPDQFFYRSVEGARRRLLALKNDAAACSARIDYASTIQELTALENKPRIDFNLVVEKCVRLVNDALFFERHRKFIARLVVEYDQWRRGNKFEMLSQLIEHGFENGAATTDEAMRTMERDLAILKAYDEEVNISLRSRTYNKEIAAIKERCWRRLEDALIGSDRREQMFLVRWMGDLIE